MLSGGTEEMADPTRSTCTSSLWFRTISDFGARAPSTKSEGRTSRGDSGHLVLRERIALQFVVSRAIVLQDSPRWEVPHRRKHRAGSI